MRTLGGQGRVEGEVEERYRFLQVWLEGNINGVMYTVSISLNLTRGSLALVGCSNCFTRPCCLQSSLLIFNEHPFRRPLALPKRRQEQIRRCRTSQILIDGAELPDSAFI